VLLISSSERPRRRPNATSKDLGFIFNGETKNSEAGPVFTVICPLDPIMSSSIVQYAGIPDQRGKAPAEAASIIAYPNPSASDGSKHHSASDRI